MLNWLIQQPLFPVFIYNIFTAIKQKDKKQPKIEYQRMAFRNSLEAEITLDYAIDLQLINTNDIYGKTYLRSTNFVFEIKVSLVTVTSMT